MVDKFRENKKLALADYLDANRKKSLKIGYVSVVNCDCEGNCIIYIYIILL